MVAGMMPQPSCTIVESQSNAALYSRQKLQAPLSAAVLPQLLPAASCCSL